jgi:hypothetical protein
MLSVVETSGELNDRQVKSDNAVARYMFDYHLATTFNLPLSDSSTGSE